MQKEKSVEQVGFDSYVLFNSSALWIGDNKELPSWIAEVVGSNPTQSIFINLVKYGIELSLV
jgi:hypothetical protein